MLGFTLILILTIIIVKYLTSNNDYWKKRNVEQVNGILWEFLFKKKALPLIYKDIYERFPKLPYVGVFLGMKPTLVLRDLKNIQAVLHGDFHSFYARGLVVNDGDVLGDNLLFAENYNRWKLLRQKMTPTVTIKKVRNMLYVTERCAKDFVKYIEENPQILEDPYTAIYKYTTACISATVFGIPKEVQNIMKTPLNEMAARSVKPSWATNLKFAISNISPKLFQLMDLRAFSDHETLFTEVLRSVMQKRRNENETYDDFIDACIKLEDEGVMKDFVTGYETKVTLPFLAAQAFVFVLGGIDSTSNALHFTLLELANNPKMLQRVHDEIDGVLKNNDDTLTYAAIEKLEYTEMVLLESMRKHPPVGSVQRRCCKDTVLPVGDVKIEKDTIMIIPIYAIHRDERYFPNPDVFDPERFSAENISKIDKYSYLAFGEGKRICIAVKFSTLEMKVCLAWLLRKYTIKPQPYTPRNFAPSFFSLHEPNASLEIIPRVQN